MLQLETMIFLGPLTFEPIHRIAELSSVSLDILFKEMCLFGNLVPAFS